MAGNGLLVAVFMLLVGAAMIGSVGIKTPMDDPFDAGGTATPTNFVPFAITVIVSACWREGSTTVSVVVMVTGGETSLAESSDAEG